MAELNFKCGRCGEKILMLGLCYSCKCKDDFRDSYGRPKPGVKVCPHCGRKI